MFTDTSIADKLSMDNHNKKIIFDKILESKEFSISEIAQAAKLSVPTVIKFVKALYNDGVLEDVGKPELNRKGKRAIYYRIKPDYCYFLGVDVKAFELNLGLMNLSGELVHTEQIRDFVFDNTKIVVDEISSHIDEFIRKLHISKKLIARANFNLGGRVNSLAGTSASVFNFEDNQETPLAEYLSEIIGIPVLIENDSKAMAYAELMNRPNPSWKNILYVNASWGIGLGIIINGEMYYGKDGYAGEFGHIHQYNNDVMCHCGNKGCIETEISGRAILRLLKHEIIDKRTPCTLWDKVWRNERITTVDLVTAVKSGDKLCQELFAQTGSKLGTQLSGLINLFNPDGIIIGGYLAEAPEKYFIEPIKDVINKYSLSLMNQHLSVVTSALGQNAGIIGACLIARNKTIAGTFYN